MVRKGKIRTKVAGKRSKKGRKGGGEVARVAQVRRDLLRYGEKERSTTRSMESKKKILHLIVASRLTYNHISSSHLHPRISLFK